MKSYDQILAAIRSRTREGWELHWRERLTDVRIWIQEHGEQAAALGLVLGIGVVIFFKFFVAMVFTVLLGGYAVWHLALPQDQQDKLDRK